MKYLLGIGITASIYKKSPRVRVYLDDAMLDEYSITDSNHGKGPHTGYDGKLCETINLVMPHKLKIYVIDHTQLKGKRSLHLHFDNDDSNYTNGFITKSTVVDFNHIFLAPLQYVTKVKDLHFEKLKLEIKHMIPDFFEGQQDNDYKFKMRERHILGYPFPLVMHWEGEECNDAVRGGSGTATIQIIEKSGWFMLTDFEQLIKEDMHVDNNTHHQNKKGFEYPKLTGFPLSKIFKQWTLQGHFDKYLHEDQ